MAEIKSRSSKSGISKRQWFLQGTGLYLIILFAYTGGHKILDNDPLYITLINAPLYLDNPYATWMSWGIPIVEISIAVSLCSPKIKKYGFIASFLVLLVFTLYTGYIVIIADQRPCSCGGIFSLLTWEQHLIINDVSMLLALTAIILTKKSYRDRSGMS